MKVLQYMHLFADFYIEVQRLEKFLTRILTCLVTQYLSIYFISCSMFCILQSAISPDGSYILGGSSDGNAYIWQVSVHFIYG